MDSFDFRTPDYAAIFRSRLEALDRIRANPGKLPALKAYYRDNPAQFISDWGVTVDPRNVEIGQPAIIPFILFQRQREWVEWVVESWKARRPGVTAKSRESGVSWLAVSLAATLCLFHEGLAIGFGSRKEEYVDKVGAPKSLFWKARKFIELLPAEFRGSFDPKNDAPHMRILFHDTGSVITGEAGDNIGRGDRASLYIVDEAAFLERPELTEAALSATTNCRIDVSTPNGQGNPFHRKVTEWPSERVFRFHWRDDPRKNEEWYQKHLAELDAITVAQEIDIDFAASVEGVVIPSAWVQAAIDARKKLGLFASGARGLSFDVADEGLDKNAICRSYGMEVEGTEAWSGKGADIFGTVQRVFDICDEHGYRSFDYDADGLGAGVRGDARIINEQRRARLQTEISAISFRGSEAPINPEGIVEGTRGAAGDKGRTNQDFFQNRKAQGWWALRKRFQKTYRWVSEGLKCDPDEIISISSACPNYRQLVAELSQPTYSTNAVGKILINKKPDGMRSPNLADTVMMRFAPRVRGPMIISPDAMRRVGLTR